MSSPLGSSSSCESTSICGSRAVVLRDVELYSLAYFCTSAGYPLISHFTERQPSTLGAFNLGGINASGQVPVLEGRFALIDPDTPQDAYTRQSPLDSSQTFDLVFSDEFNVDGRTFYPGDDPYWEAVDIWYGSTADQEWYDPSKVTTKNGALQITMESVTDITLNHDLQYKSGMLQSWNKFCFTSGYIEVSMTLPGPDSSTKGYVSTSS